MQTITPAGVPHQCLRVAEIQALIFKSLTQLDCVDLARTCSWFYEEAMNVVWADVCSLVPFAKCMPSDIIDETERWNCFTIVSFNITFCLDMCTSVLIKILGAFSPI